MFERFTANARSVVSGAMAEAKRLNHSYVGTEHVLISLLEPGRGMAAAVLADAGLTQAGVREQVLQLIGGGGLTALDAEALGSIGIDLDAVRASLERTFGEGALDPQPPAPPAGRTGGIVGGHLPFTKRSKEVLAFALREAVQLRHNYIGTEHILLGIIREGEGLAARVIDRSGVELSELRRRTLAAIEDAAA